MKKMKNILILFLLFCVAAGSAKEMKKRVAVFTFEDKSSHKWHWWTGQPVGEGMADMLITSLVKTEKYTVIERTQIQKIMEEQALGMSGAVTQQTAAKVGQLLGVDIAIFGAVTEFGYTEGGGNVDLNKLGFGVGLKSTKAVVAVDVRFVNTSTGEILDAESVRSEKSKKGLKLRTDEFRFDNRHKFDESLVGKATREAIDQLVDIIGNKASSIKWQGKLVKGNPIILNAGAEAGIENGDEFVVFRAGEELIDPDTGLNLGSTEQQIGIIKVTNNGIGNGKASQCTAVSGSGFLRGDLVREK